MQAKLNLNIEAEPVTPTAASTVAGAPTFTEKPKIETLEGGKRVQMIVRYKAEAQCQCQWFFKETKVVESTTTKVVHEKRESYYECRLEMTVSNVEKNVDSLESLKMFQTISNNVFKLNLIFRKLLKSTQGYINVL